MSKKVDVELFKDFLRYKDCEVEFLNNCDLVEHDWDHWVEDVGKKVSVHSFVVGSFPWNRGHRGMEFWSRLNGEWQAYYSMKVEKVKWRYNEFVAWMKEHNAWRLYIKNMNVVGVTDVEDKVKCWIVGFATRAIINYSFVWEDTPEGVDYWVGIHRKWCDYCDSGSAVQSGESEGVEGVKESKDDSDIQSLEDRVKFLEARVKDLEDFLMGVGNALQSFNNR